MPLTTDAVLALAPDAASAKAALGLVRPAQWPTLGASDAAVWGECQGSGSKPYQTQVDLAGPAFRCSCPSRKFPCKHGLALLLMRAQQPAGFTATEAPGWVSEWLAGRADKAEKQAEKQATKATTAPADPQAADKREAQRWQRIETAAQDLQRWLADQIARGLGALDDSALQNWATMARRMVDAQAPGLGQRLQAAATGVRRGADWPEQTLQRLGLLQLACEGLNRRGLLTASEQADLRVVAGWPMDRDEVLAHGPRETDRWTVLGCVTEERDDRLTERRTWLHGERSGRRAFLLDHAFGGRGFEQAWVTGSAVDATLAFFPSGSGLRALLVDAAAPAGTARWPVTQAAEEFNAVARRVAGCPWVGLHPVVLCDALPLRHGDRLLLIVDGRVLPLALRDADIWTLLAISGGHALNLAGEWDGQAFAPLTSWSSGDLQWLRSAA
ncbi:SWIM zinc finger family protein [Roseateles sp. LYH14W]|uniref:SWIM zinc finger family protein n=1 Tax=Pelomonas parva TaxID=3299032 RepID=A0ABW7F6G6_9BURK